MHGCARRHGRNGRRGGSAVAGSRVLLAARCRPREVRDQGQRAGPLRGADSRGRGAGCQRRLLRPPRRRSTLLRDPGRRRQRAARGARLIVRWFVRGAVASAGNGDCTAGAGTGDTRVPLDRHAPACPGRVLVRRLGEHPVRARSTVSRPIGSAGVRHFGYFSRSACCARRLVIRRIREHAGRVRSAPQHAAVTGLAQHQVVLDRQNAGRFPFRARSSLRRSGPCDPARPRPIRASRRRRDNTAATRRETRRSRACAGRAPAGEARSPRRA